MVVPNNQWVFPTKNDHVGVFWVYHHLRKHPYGTQHLSTVGVAPTRFNWNSCSSPVTWPATGNVPKWVAFWERLGIGKPKETKIQIRVETLIFFPKVYFGTWGVVVVSKRCMYTYVWFIFGPFGEMIQLPSFTNIVHWDLIIFLRVSSFRMSENHTLWGGIRVNNGPLKDALLSNVCRLHFKSD